MTGVVYLVGAGPGDPGLITVRGREILAAADVVVYDRLIGAELLELCRADASQIYVGKEAARHAMTQDEINDLLVQHAQAGKMVCRLKGGDPFVFGRAGEEALHCRAHGVTFEVVPGVTSSIAAPAYAGIPVTHREVAASFAVVTGHTKDEEAPPASLPTADTLVFLMGVRALPRIVQQLLENGRAPETPVALVRWGTTVQQEVVTGTLATIEAEVARAGLKPPALIVVGDVVNLRERLRWFDNRPLWGNTIIVTRAREQASGLVQGLKQHGAAVLECPTIRVEPLDDYSLLDASLARLAEFNWVVFTSANGVRHFWQRLEGLGRDARALAVAKIAAIGPATAQALRERGLRADFIPDSSISENVAEGLLERGADVGQVLITGAVGGRDVLREKLLAAGTRVTTAPCYRTVPDNANAEAARELLTAGKVDWITFTSSSTVTNFIAAIGEDTLAQCRPTYRIACIGPITARTAQDNGLQPDVVAAQASIDALLQALTNAPS